MTDDLLPAVVHEPSTEPRASIIWLHGLGADGHDFGPIVPELGIRDDAGVRFVFPHAPARPVTLNGGMVMRAWYDIRGLDFERDVPEEDLETSRAQLEAWIDHERGLGVKSERIVVAGFSQGGAIALYAGLPHAERLGGILALSCYHPALARLDELIAPANRDVPVFMAHGTQDPIVPLDLAQRTVAALGERGLSPEWHTYPMTHSVSPEEVRDIARWLSETLGA